MGHSFWRPDLSWLYAWKKKPLQAEVTQSEVAGARGSNIAPDVELKVASEVPRMYSVEPKGSLSVIMLGEKDGALRKPAGWLEGQAVSLCWLDSFAKARAMLSLRGKFSHLLIDVDSLGGVHKIFDSLRRFRDEMPDVPVILFSRDFHVDDLDLDRIWLCDASLRPSASFTTVELALTISLINNDYWCGKAKSLTGEIVPSGD